MLIKLILFINLCYFDTDNYSRDYYAPSLPGYRPTVRERLRRKIENVDDMLSRYAVSDASCRHPLRTLAKLTVRGILRITRFVLLLAHAVSPRWRSDNSDEIHRMARGGENLPSFENLPALHYSNFINDIERIISNADSTRRKDSYLGREDGRAQPTDPSVPTEEWIQATPVTAMEHPDKPLEMPRHSIDSSTDIESGDLRYLP